MLTMIKGEMQTLYKKRTRIPRKCCSILNCPNKHYGKGYCQKHYTRLVKHGDPLTMVYQRTGRCLVVDCHCGPKYRRGLCSKHYKQARRLKLKALQDALG